MDHGGRGGRGKTAGGGSAVRRARVPPSAAGKAVIVLLSTGQQHAVEFEYR